MKIRLPQYPFWQYIPATAVLIFFILIANGLFAQTITSTSKGGLWNSGATWQGGVVPQAGQNVIILDSAIVLVNVAVTGINNLTIGQGTSGILQLHSSLTMKGNLLIGNGAKFIAHDSNLFTGQTINLGGNFINNGQANLAAPSTILNFNGSQQAGGSLSQQLEGTGTFTGDGTNGIIRSLRFQTTGNSTINTTQNLIVTESFYHTAGTLNTNSKLSIDNTAQVYGQPLNRQVYGISVTGMGTGYTNAPVIYGASVILWTASGAGLLNNRYFFGNNVYLCIGAGVFDGSSPPVHTSGITNNGSASLFWQGTLGTLGIPISSDFSITGTQYFYSNNLYTALNNGGVASFTNPPACTSGVCISGTVTFLYAGSPAKVTPNYDAVTQTIRSVTLTDPGVGYTTSAPSLVFSPNGGSVTNAAIGNILLIQSIAGPSNSLTQKSPSAVINGAINIKSNQGVGGITTSNGGANYSAPPRVGFSLPTSFLNLVTNGGSGYTSTPLITVSGGNILPGGNNPTFNVVVAQGKVVSVICNGGGTLWQSPPTLTITGGGGSGATCAFPVGCLPAATAVITNGTVTDFNISSSGFGYATAPAVGLVTNGTATLVANTPACRIGLYNLTYNFLAPATTNPPANIGAEIPANNRVSVLSLGSTASANSTANIILQANLELYSSSGALAFPASVSNGNLLNLNGNTLSFSHPTYAGTTGSPTLGSVTNGLVKLSSPGGQVTRNFPFDATVVINTGSGTGATGSSITSLTASRTGAASGTVTPSGNITGLRAYRVQSGNGESYGTNPSVTLNFNVNDSLFANNPTLFIAQSAILTGTWNIRSLSTGTGQLPATGSRTTATATPGPIVPTGDDYFAWVTTYVPPLPLAYSVTRTTGNVYQSIAPVINGGNGTGTLSAASGDEGTQTITFPAGMSFLFQGSPCTGFTIHANGYIALRNDYYPPALGSSWDNTLVPSTIGGTTDPLKRNIIAPFYEDLDKASPVIYYKFSGKLATIEWYNSTFFSLPGPQLYFQIVLDGNDNSIQFNYGNIQLYNGTQNIRWSYTCGLSGVDVANPPLAGQVFQQQYENTTAFGHLNATTANLGANGLAISPEPRSSLKFIPGTYSGYTPPVPTPPINDEAANAIIRPSLTSFPDNIAWDTVNNTSNLFTARYATHSALNICSGPATAKDVWFKFNANNPQMTVRIYASGGFIPRLQVLDSSLNPLTTPICIVGATGLIVNAQLDSLVLDKDYYVRVYHDRTGNTATATANITNGTVSSINLVNGGSNYVDITPPYPYVPTNTNTRITLTGGGGINAEANGLITSGSFSSLTIRNGGSGYTSSPIITIESPDYGVTGEFAIIIFAIAQNDNCSTATELTGLSSSVCNLGTNAATASTIPATASSEAAVCGIPDDDVWYKFTADKVKTKITVSGSGNFNPALQIFDGGASPGNCTSKTSVQCLNATGAGGTETVILNTLIGNTYFLRVYHAGTGTVPGEKFTICVSSAFPACIPTPVTPGNNSVVCTGPNILRWNKSTDATGYLVYLNAGTAPATTLVATKTVNTDTTYSAGILQAGSYSWRVEPTNSLGSSPGCSNWAFTRAVVLRDTVTVSGCNSVLYQGTTYTSSTIRNDTLHNNAGCDSLIRLANIIVMHVVPVTQNISLTGCNNGVLYQGITYYTSTIVRDTIRSYQGCDSIYIVANINITNIPPLANPTNLIPIDNRTGLNIPVNFSWSLVPDALLYDFYLWKAVDNEPSTASVSNLTQINFTYPGNLLYGTNYKWKVVAKHQNCQSVSAVQTFTTRFLPDLIVENVQPAATGFSGQPFTVNWTVKNTGTGATLNQQWIDRVYISTDNILDLGFDISLGTVSNPTELSANGSYQQTATFTLPQGINNNYYVFVVTNAFNQLLEANFANNTGISNTTVAIQLTPPPDLVVSSIVPPNFAFSGQPINFTWQVTNNGTGSTIVSDWSDNVYLSANSDGNLTGAVYLGAYSHSGALNAGNSYSSFKTVNLPNGISGKYYLYVTTDIYNQVYEHALEGNNIKRSDSIMITLTPPVDLIVKDIIIPALASNRQNITVSWKVENQGGSSTQGNNWVDHVYVSRLLAFNPDSVILLGSFQNTAALDAGQEYNSQNTVSIPGNITGPYYFYVKADATNSIYENVYENNNVSRSNGSSNVLSPDLVVTKITAPLTDSSGKSINIQWYIKNNGPGTLFNASIKDRILISLNPVYSPGGNIELLQKIYSSGQLVTGDSALQQAAVLLPEGIAGNYYVYINTDYENAVFENNNENNNITRSTVPINIVLTPWPDLQGNNVMIVPDTATAGDVVPVSYTVTNNGIGPTRQSVWTDNIYISQSPVFDSASATFLRSFTHNGILAKDSGYHVNTSVQIPGSAAGGKYYIYLYCDADNNVYEFTAENNNIKKGDSIYINQYPPIDLALTDIIAPDSASSGNTVNISWSVENNAQAITLQNQWTDALYLSTDTLLSTGDIFVKEVAHSGALAPGMSYAVSHNFVLPNGIAGKYYALLVADNHNVNFDINRRNNYKLTGVNGDSAIMIIALTPPPDLTISSFTIPNSGPAGQPVKAKFTIKNNGPGNIKAGASWTDKIYLSTDFVLDPASDLEIGTLVKAGPLNAGQVYTDSIDVFLPISAFGNYVIFIKTDANNTVYEHSAEQNNTSYELITIEQQLLSDLIVSEINAPAEAIAGDSVTIGWKVKNTGLNPSSGYMKNAVYLSTDTIKSINDALLVSVQTIINIAPQAEQSYSFSGELTGVPLNDYYVLVHTDVLNNIYETSDSNNISASVAKMKVTVRQLPINVLTVRNMTNNKEVYYRIEVPDSLANQTLLITLKGDSLNGNNEMYLRFGGVPTRAVYDFSHSLPSGGNQEILVPALQHGTYYLMLYGNTSPGNVQSISLLARILNFEIRSINDTTGGNTGQVTIQIKGSKLGTVNAVRLRAGNRVITATGILIKDPATLFATFNLAGAQTGLYDVVAQNAAGDTAISPQGFRIVAGNAGGLETNVLAPASTRPSNIISMTVEFRNTGNTDLINPVLKLTSLGGAPIAFNPSGLDSNKTSLMLTLQELNGPIGRLRPGAGGSIIVYAKTLTALSFILFKEEQ